MVTLTHTHPHPDKRSHPAKRRSYSPTHNWKKECHVSKTYVKVFPFHNITRCLHFWKRLTGSGVHPVYLGPTLLHFTKDTQTFTRFALEIQACNPETRGIKKTGVDIEDAIYNGVEILFTEAQQLYCVRHLKQWGEMQILKMMDRKKCTEKEKIMAKKEIILDVYGQKRDTLYEYGLAESSDETEFCGKLNSLQRKWGSRCKGFFDWFCRNRKQKFINSVICSACDGSNVDGLFHQNDIESQHFVEKVQQNFWKEKCANYN